MGGQSACFACFSPLSFSAINSTRRYLAACWNVSAHTLRSAQHKRSSEPGERPGSGGAAGGRRDPQHGSYRNAGPDPGKVTDSSDETNTNVITANFVSFFPPTPQCFFFFFFFHPLRNRLRRSLDHEVIIKTNIEILKERPTSQFYTEEQNSGEVWGHHLQ